LSKFKIAKLYTDIGTEKLLRYIFDHYLWLVEN